MSVYKTLLLSCILACLHSEFSAKTPYQMVVYKNIGTALEYSPPSLNTTTKPVRVIMALYGLNQSPKMVFPHWKPIADKLGAILICPQGSHTLQAYLRLPNDDRKQFIRYKNALKKKYRFTNKDVVLAGFSRGGNFAIETGLLFPKEFPNVLCIFGFFNTFNTKKLQNQARLKALQNSQFLFITGNGDLTKQSLTNGYKLLKSHHIPATLKVYPNLIHDYPKDLSDQIHQSFY